MGGIEEVAPTVVQGAEEDFLVVEQTVVAAELSRIEPKACMQPSISTWIGERNRSENRNKLGESGQEEGLCKEF